MHKNENTKNSHSFLALDFSRGICLSRHQRIWNQQKILRFLLPILIFFKKKIFWVIIALFAFLKCKCEKNYAFSNILQKVKSYFFANIYHSPCDSYKVWNIEAPYCVYHLTLFCKVYFEITTFSPLHISVFLRSSNVKC